MTHKFLLLIYVVFTVTAWTKAIIKNKNNSYLLKAYYVWSSVISVFFFNLYWHYIYSFLLQIREILVSLANQSRLSMICLWTSFSSFIFYYSLMRTLNHSHIQRLAVWVLLAILKAILSVASEEASMLWHLPFSLFWWCLSAPRLWGLS